MAYTPIKGKNKRERRYLRELEIMVYGKKISFERRVYSCLGTKESNGLASLTGEYYSCG